LPGPGNMPFALLRAGHVRAEGQREIVFSPPVGGRPPQVVKTSLMGMIFIIKIFLEYGTKTLDTVINVVYK